LFDSAARAVPGKAAIAAHRVSSENTGHFMVKAALRYPKPGEE
jgi:hypothetical protein